MFCFVLFFQLLIKTINNIVLFLTACIVYISLTVITSSVKKKKRLFFFVTQNYLRPSQN